MERAKFDFGNAGKTGVNRLNSSGNAIRVKHNPMLLWKHKNEIYLRPLMEASFEHAREHLSKKILEEVDAIFKETQKTTGSVPEISGDEHLKRMLE